MRAEAAARVATREVKAEASAFVAISDWSSATCDMTSTLVAFESSAT